MGPLTTALSKIKTNIPAAYKPIIPATEIYPISHPISSLGALFSASTTKSIGSSKMPPPPLPPILTSISATNSASINDSKVENFNKKKEKVFEKKDLSMTLPPPPQPPSFGSFDRLPTKICMNDFFFNTLITD